MKISTKLLQNYYSKCLEENAGDTDGTKEEVTNGLTGHRRLDKKPLSWFWQMEKSFSGREVRKKHSINKKYHMPRSRGVIYHVPLGGTVSLVSLEVGAQMEVLQDVRQRRNSWWGTLNALPRTLGFILKAMEDEWRVLRRRAITVRFRKITWTYSKENGLHVGNCLQGDQTRDYCKIISKKWGERTHKQW